MKIKKILSIGVTIAAIFTMSLSTSANLNLDEQIKNQIPEILHEPENTTVSPGSIFAMNFSFHKSTIKDVDSFSFRITDYGELTMALGSSEVTNAELGKTYTYKFAAPEKPNSSVSYIRYTVDYTYELNGKTIEESKNFSAKIEIKGSSENEKGSVSFENIIVNDSSVGTESIVTGQIVNTWSYEQKNATIQITDENNNLLVKKYIGKITSALNENATEFSLTVPAFASSGSKIINIKLDYTDKENKKYSIGSKAVLKVLKSEPLLIKNFTHPVRITADNSAQFSFNLINKNKTEYNNVQLYFYKNESLVHTEYIGLVAAQQQTAVKFNYTFNSTGTANYKVVIRYENTADANLSVEYAQKLTVHQNSPLELNNITFPEKITTKTLTEVKFNLINKSEIDFSNAEAFLYKENQLMESTYIGVVTAQSQIAGVLTHTFEKADKGVYTLRIKYNDAAGKQQSTEKKIQLVIEPFEGTDEEAGALKIQTIVPPVEALVNSRVNFSFALTNPTSVKLTGIEVLLNDENGNQINSIYISEIEANSSSRYDDMSFVSRKTEGVGSYTLKVIYKDLDGKEKVLTKTFAVNTVIEKTTEESERPANLKIQKINNPAIIYTNVKTAIPFILVNAGKGTAFNVEIYVLDGDGKEIAREYIGAIKAADKLEASYSVKYAASGDFKATMYVSYENADENMIAVDVEKSYDQQVIDYRANIMDIAGYEYLEVGGRYNIEFSVINNGTETLLNTTALLMGNDGVKYAELFVGTVEPGSKKERLRFRNVAFNTPGPLDLTVSVTYENTDMNVFKFESAVSTTVNEPYVPDMSFVDGGMVDGGMMVDGVINADMNTTVEQENTPWWVFALIIGGGCIVALVVVIIVVKQIRKKGKSKSEDDDIEYFLKQLSIKKTDNSEDKKNEKQ